MQNNRILVTDGAGNWSEEAYPEPTCPNDGVVVSSIFTGVCRSDVDMATGAFPLLPKSMSGHEGLGRVIEVGEYTKNVKLGDIVATRGEPAYADRYAAAANTFVVVPEADPKYILEPVACGINCWQQAYQEIIERGASNCLILGSGFLARVVYITLSKEFPNLDIDVLGSSNIDLWGDTLLFGTTDSYDIVIDLSGKYSLGDEVNLNDNALVIDAVGKELSKTEAQQLLWKAVTTIRPSPRNPNFIYSMRDAAEMIENGELTVDTFWTRAYNRNTQWQQAFKDAAQRQPGYSRGYICWEEQ